MGLNQPSLSDWTPPRARRTDPETSVASAERASFSASKGRMLALRTLVELGPLTDFQLAEATGKAQTSIGVRRKELRDAGLVEVLCDSTGKKETRPSPSGSASLVWFANETGRRFYENQGRDA